MRTIDRILTLVVGFALFLLSGLVVVEIIHAALNNPKPLLLPYPSVAEFFRSHRWSAGWIVAGAIVLILLGSLLVISEFRRRRPALLVIRSTDPQVVAGISRRSVKRLLATEIGAVPGVEKTSTRIGRSRAKVTAVTWIGAPDNVESEAMARGQSALDGLHLQKAPRLALTVTAGKS